MKDLPRHLVAAAVLVLAFGIVAGLFLLEIPEGNREVALVVLGIAIGWAGSVVGFHFGTSQGSTRKSEIFEAQRRGEL